MRTAWIYAAAFVALSTGHEGREGGEDTPPPMALCSPLELSSRVRIAQGSLSSHIGQVDGREILSIDFEVELDVEDDGTYRLLDWSELETHHDRKLHLVLAGADYGTFVHAHPVSQM